MKVKRAGRWCAAVPSVLCIGGCAVCVVKMQLAVQPLVTLSNVAGSHCSCSTGWFVYYLGGQQKKEYQSVQPRVWWSWLVRWGYPWIVGSLSSRQQGCVGSLQGPYNHFTTVTGRACARLSPPSTSCCLPASNGLRRWTGQEFKMHRRTTEQTRRSVSRSIIGNLQHRHSRQPLNFSQPAALGTGVACFPATSLCPSPLCTYGVPRYRSRTSLSDPCC